MSTQWLAGRVLRFEGEASIGSDFVNDGTIGPLGTGCVPSAGQQFALFDFDSFSGRLGAADITVTGFDRELLDFSRLAVDGTLTVTAVPEPGTWATLCAGLLAVGGVLNRRRRVE